MSELVSEGYSDAPDYPIAFVWEEIQLIADRKNRSLASEATILQAAISTGVSAFGKDGGRKAHAAFQKLVKTLIGDDLKEEVRDGPQRHRDPGKDKRRQSLSEREEDRG